MNMNGAGFMMDATNNLRKNRSLLKGSGRGRYKNFDKSYITDYPITKKTIKCEKASVEQIAHWRKKLQAQLKRRKKMKLLILSVSRGVVSFLGYLLFIF